MADEQLEIDGGAAQPAPRVWEATRWGNDADGGNGPDTNYLVVAPDHEAAARAVAAQRGDHVVTIFELGLCTGGAHAAAHVVRGPYVEHRLNTVAHFTSWDRDDELGAWVPTPACHDGVARCAYASGARAAEIEYVDGKAHGRAERWYADGTPMARETYVHGFVTGVCEWWYDDGRPARRYAFVDVSRKETELTTTRWDRAGNVVGPVTERQPRPRAR